MHTTSDLYKEILSGNHTTEIKLRFSSIKTFFMEDLISVKVVRKAFPEEGPSVGGCRSGEIFVEMFNPKITIPRRQKMVLSVRITDGSRYSEWLDKGSFYIDTRQVLDKDTPLERLVIHGYDALIKAEKNYPSSEMAWPARDIDVVYEAADAIGVDVSAETVAAMTDGFLIQYPADLTCRETLGYIAAMYAGCFIINDLGELHLVMLNGIPKETYYLLDEAHKPILIGGVPILVR
jgi:hypothetical protein